MYNRVLSSDNPYCFKYGSTLNPSHINEKKESKQKRKRGEFSVFYRFWGFHKNPIIDLLFNDRLRRLLRLVNFDSNGYSVGLEIGCGSGYLSRYLACQINGIVIGVDLSKAALKHGKFFTDWGTLSLAQTDFVLADANHLPFRPNSFDVVVCASVFEHIKELRRTLEEISNSIRDSGHLIAGYPIEMKLFTILVKLFTPEHMKIRDPQILGKEHFDQDPHTHKQSFTTIRSLLQEYFTLRYKEKSFFTILPDALSWYECVKMRKKQLSCEGSQNSSCARCTQS